LAFVGDVMRATFAVMEMHMRKRSHLVVLTELVASVLVASEDQMIDQIKGHLDFWLVTTHLA